MKLSVIIPCYNEEVNIPEIYNRLSKVCAAIGEGYELIFINDGSKDASWSVMSGLAEKDGHVVAANLSRNYGHQIALTSGLQISRGELVLVIDADLQDPPELLPEMLRKIEEGADVVYAVRKSRAGEGLFKTFTAKLFYRLLNLLTDIKIPIDTGDFRLMKRNVVQSFLAMPESHRFIRGMIAWVGFNQVPLPYERDKRYSGKTKYTFRKMVHFAMDAISGFSVQPLRVTFYLGIILAFFGVILLGYIARSWITGNTVPGWSSLAVLLVFLQSCQFIFLGIIGEYIGRIFIETKRRPLFFVSEVKRKNG